MTDIRFKLQVACQASLVWCDMMATKHWFSKITAGCCSNLVGGQETPLTTTNQNKYREFMGRSLIFSLKDEIGLPTEDLGIGGIESANQSQIQLWAKLHW